MNVAGFLRGEFGLAEAARATVRALTAADVPHALNNVPAPHHRELDVSTTRFSDDNPYRVNLVHVNPAELPEFWRARGAAYRRGRYNIGFWYWEMPRLPPRWMPAFRGLNEIWVASSFCQQHLASVSPVPVVKMICPVAFDEAELHADRARFGLPEHTFVFLFAFDCLSVVERKNPLAVCAAFARAFAGRDDVLLVVKCMNSQATPAFLDEIRRATRGFRFQLLDGHLAREQSLELLQTADCFVSLHRSEGLGLGLAESMYLGKPTIATGYGGNMDFMTPANSFLVNHRMVELERDHGPYQRGDRWADPDVDHAATLMRQVESDPRLARERGVQAAADIREKLSPRAAGLAMASRLRVIAGG